MAAVARLVQGRDWRVCVPTRPVCLDPRPLHKMLSMPLALPLYECRSDSGNCSRAASARAARTVGLAEGAAAPR
jgi:hypothetical protein